MKGFFLFISTLILFSFASPLYSQAPVVTESEVGTGEYLSLFEIDKLIRKTEYDEALKYLNIYIEKNPEQFDNAQTRIGKIMNAKIRYSELAEELVETIRNDPTNNKKIYEITAELEKFERNPSDQNLRFIADAKKSAEFNYFRAQFLEIQNGVAENVNNGLYVDAVKKAQEGFWLYKDAFYIKWEDNPEIIQNVESIVNELNLHLQMYEDKNFIPEIEKAVLDFNKAVTMDQYEQAVKRLKNVTNLLKEYNELRKAIIGDMNDMENMVVDLQQIDPDMTDASYLPFLIHFIKGSEAISNSGILGAVNGQWNAFIGDMNDVVFAMITKKYDTYKIAVNDDFVEDISNYVSLESDIQNLYKIPNSLDKFIIENPYLDYMMLADYVNNLSKSMFDANVMIAKVKENEITQLALIDEFKNAESIKDKDKAVSELLKKSADLEKIGGGKSDLLLENLSWTNEYRKSQYTNWDDLAKKYTDTINEIFNTKDSIAKNTWNEISGFYVVKSEEFYKEVESLNNIAGNYSNGLMEKIPEENLVAIDKNILNAVEYVNVQNEKEIEDLGILYRYPDISIQLYTYAQKLSESRIDEINSYIIKLNQNVENQEIWKNNKTIVSGVIEVNDKLKQQIQNIMTLQQQISKNYNIAKNMIISSQVAKNEGDLRYAEAEKALKRDDFETARRKLESALRKYDEALNNQNDEKLRAKWDNKLQQLGEEIAKSENELIVRQVRELKIAAKDAYFNGRFDDAEKYLNQASVKWAITNITEDPEITNLMNFVNTAISMKTGREIVPSAPQYPEMSQLMNIAHQSFDEGCRLRNKGQIEESDKQFDLALNSIQKVQYVYPLNQEAALLTLQINQIKDPKKFKDEFSQKIETAKMLCESSETQQEGYANLLDYYKLDPNYPGLKDLIYQVEIDIGIRQKPVDNSGKIKANRYIAEAEKLYSKAGNDLEKLNKALDKINQALVLLPDDAYAMKLKDKITTKMGGNASTVLSTEDERLYQLAIQRLQNNNIVGANAIVDQLLKKPQNRYSQKIKDLKNKIEARS